ncbi:MAG: CHAD domain-containing protein [Acidimicrobiales bacterium]
MTTAWVPGQYQSLSGPPTETPPSSGTQIDGNFPAPTAGMVLHRVLAGAARTFLLNDMDRTAEDTDPCGSVDAQSVMGNPPVWAQSVATALDNAQRRPSATERIHQSRVALRRIRSNLRTFRLALHPAWGTSLRAEVAWYADQLGEARDLHILGLAIATHGPDAMGADRVAELETVVAARMASALADIASVRGGARRFQLTEQMMVLWDGPAFKAKAERPAQDVLPVLLHRAWHDLRGASRVARKDSTEANLHKLRIRLKDLRYGCETVALIEGGPARKTAKAAERLQSKLGDLHDAYFSIAWLEDLARDRHDLAEPIDRLIAVQRDTVAAARQGWKRELKEIERRWRRWQG